MDRQEIEEAAERICQHYDEVFYAYFNRILEEVRASNQADVKKTLGQSALQELK